MYASLYEAARITGGRITQTHNNHCPAIADQPGPCSCAEPSYRLIITSKRMASHLTITSKAGR